jgi:hypothetical protein
MEEGRGEVPGQRTRGSASLRIGEPRTVFRLHRSWDWPFVIFTAGFLAAASLLILLAR